MGCWTILELQDRIWNRCGDPKKCRLGAWKVTLDTPALTLSIPGSTLATHGVTWEPRGSQNWINPMIAFRSGTILDLQGDIWGAIWGHFEVFLRSFFGIVSRCVFDGVFGHFGHRFRSQN